MSNLIKASDCKCCVCGKQAVAFWPVCDPDIPSYPYCRKCLDKEKITALAAIYCNGDINAAKAMYKHLKKEIKKQQ